MPWPCSTSWAPTRPWPTPATCSTGSSGPAHERFTRRELFTALPRGRFPKVDALDPALELLEAHGYVRRAAQPAPKGPGRPPSPTYEVNPLRRPRTARPGISADSADSAEPSVGQGRLPGLDMDDPRRFTR